MQDVEMGRRTTLEQVILWLCIFAMLGALVLGNMTLYERKEENRRLAEQVEEYQAELDRMQNVTERTADLKAQAQAMGMVTPDPTAVKILHIRGTD